MELEGFGSLVKVVVEFLGKGYSIIRSPTSGRRSEVDKSEIVVVVELG